MNLILFDDYLSRAGDEEQLSASIGVGFSSGTSLGDEADPGSGWLVRRTELPVEATSRSTSGAEFER